MPNNITGRFVYLVTFSVRRDEESSSLESDGGGAVFNTRAEAKTFMHAFGKELYWNNMDILQYDVEEGEEYPEPDLTNGCNRDYAVYDNYITMGTHSTDDMTDNHAYAFVKMSKVRVGNWMAYYDGEVHENIEPPSSSTTAEVQVQDDGVIVID